MSSDLLEHHSYKVLNQLMLWPVILLIGMVVIAAIARIYIYYSSYIPQIISFLSEYSVHPKALDTVQDLIENIVSNLSTSMLVLLIMNVFLIYVIWHVRKLTEAIKTSAGKLESDEH